MISVRDIREALHHTDDGADVRVMILGKSLVVYAEEVTFEDDGSITIYVRESE